MRHFKNTLKRNPRLRFKKQQFCVKICTYNTIIQPSSIKLFLSLNGRTAHPPKNKDNQQKQHSCVRCY